MATAAVAVLVAGSAPAGSLLPVQKAALVAVRRAVAAGQLDSASAAAGGAEIARAGRLIRALPGGRANHVAVALGEIAAFSGRLTKPRALTLFAELKVNDDWFAARWAPAGQTDVTDADGVVYRYFAGRCFEFHPLANFAALNALVAGGNADAARRLADALVARGVYQRGGIGWEYDFPFGGGQPPWLSGMAQAVAAQALARAAALVTDQRSQLMRAASGAYRAIPGRLLTDVAAGPWIRLYAFSATAVLNAQLQSVLSLQSYAAAAGDGSAASLAARLQRAAAASLWRFDTGYWTYYALPSELSPLGYQQYVVQLLTRLASADPRFAAAATRFAAYATQPPAFKLANGALGELRFWLSKPATVGVDTAAGPTRVVGLRDGWHTLAWQEPKRVGIYPIRVSAVDWAGNHAGFTALPIVRAAAAGAAVGGSQRSAAGSALGQPGFAIGAGIDEPSQGALAKQLGLQLVRIGVAWPTAATSPDPSVITALQRLPAGVGTLIEVRANPLPAGDAGRAALAAYAASLAQQLPTLRALILTPAPTAASAASYAAAFAAVRDAVHAAVPSSAVGAVIDGAQTPKATLAALGSGLTGADAVAFRPAASAGASAWTAANVPQLVSTLAHALGGATPPVLLDGIATPTTIPPAELAAYPAGTTEVAGAISAKAQGVAYAAAISAAACSPGVAGIVLDRLVDNATTPAPPSGLYYASGDAKASAAAVSSAATPAQRGIVVCPGLAAPVAASTITFPTKLSDSSGASLLLGCTRDCLYLVTLDAHDGSPVVARRGALQGGATPTTITLPATKLTPGTYRLDVRLVSQVNPGPVTQLQSEPLNTG